MNLFKTGLLMAGMTALFMGLGFHMGRETGMLMALMVAIGMKYRFDRQLAKEREPRETHRHRPTPPAPCSPSALVDQPVPRS